MVMRDDATFQPDDDDDFDYDAAPADYYDDRIVASDLSTLRDALKFAQRLPLEKRADFWRGNPWEKSLVGAGGKRKKAKRRVAKKEPPKPDASAAHAPRPTETPTPTLEPVGLPLEPDAATMREHMEQLVAPARERYPHARIEIAWDHAGDGNINRAMSFGIDGAGIDEAVKVAVRVNDSAERCNVYVGATLKKPNASQKRRTRANEFLVITHMPVDSDKGAEEVNAKLGAIATPKLKVTTGTIPAPREQAWCELTEPCDDAALVKHAFKALVEHVGGDTNATGLNRLMRLAGSVSRPPEYKRERGYVTELTKLAIDPNASPVDIAVFAALTPRDPPPAPREPSVKRERQPREPGDDAPLGLSFNDLASMMEAIPNDDPDIAPDYDGWVKCGAALHHETGGSDEGFDIFDDWSSRHPTYDAKKTAKTWDSFRRPYTSGQRATAATLMRMARAHGWYPNDDLEPPEPAESASPLPNGKGGEVEPPRVSQTAATPADDSAPPAAEPEPKPETSAPEPETSAPEPEQSAAPEPPPIDDKPKQEQTKTQGGKPGASAPPAAVFDPWEEFITPPFPMDVLNDVPRLREYVLAMSNAFGCDPAAVAMSALTALSGAITHETKLLMNAADDNFKVSACLWVLLVAHSGEMKTPIFAATTAPLLKIEREEFAGYQRQHDEWEREKKRDKDACGPEPPAPTPIVHNDSTIEALGIDLAANPRGALTLRDEFAGWIGSMERYGGAGGAAADRAAWLQARTGGPHRVTRVTRKGGLIANLSSSLLGGVQPHKLAEIKGLTSDGLLQRFIPVMQHDGGFPNRRADTRAARADYEQLTRECHAAPPLDVSLSPEAEDAMWELLEHLHYLARAMSGISDAMASFVNKLGGVAGNLTLILHIAANSQRMWKPVSKETVERVDRLVREYVLPHAMEFYRAINMGWNSEQLRKIASYILTSGKTTFTASDFTRNVAPLVGKDLLETVRAISPLVAGGWLDLNHQKPTFPRWTLCAGVAEAMASRRETEEREKQTLSDLKGWKRKPR
jgi:hypothetical protein